MRLVIQIEGEFDNNEIEVIREAVETHQEIDIHVSYGIEPRIMTLEGRLVGARQP